MWWLPTKRLVAGPEFFFVMLQRGDCMGEEMSLFLLCFLEGEALWEAGEEGPVADLVMNGSLPWRERRGFEEGELDRVRDFESFGGAGTWVETDALAFFLTGDLISSIESGDPIDLTMLLLFFPGEVDLDLDFDLDLLCLLEESRLCRLVALFLLFLTLPVSGVRNMAGTGGGVEMSISSNRARASFISLESYLEELVGGSADAAGAE
mmetsp:Transcript_25373/g.62445  ORF Transcript_25373/g.62445 Transcript_25373/m.62445 type:complete len:208 (+) Transcript_25373:1339-1962(+)